MERRGRWSPDRGRADHNRVFRIPTALRLRTPGRCQQVSWILPTATARYVVDLAAEDAGLVLQDWTDGEFRTWAPSDQHSFDTPPDRLPSELSALGTRQVRGADLIVDHGGALVGARLVWPLGGVDFTEEGPRTRLIVRPRHHG
jgi:hypothetical protein